MSEPLTWANVPYDYEVVMAPHGDFQSGVDVLVKAGWKPQGGVAMAWDAQMGVMVFAQAMVKGALLP